MFVLSVCMYMQTAAPAGQILHCGAADCEEITCCDPSVQQCESPTDGTIYKYQAKTLNGSHTVNFSDFAGQSVLFINVATY